MAWSYEEDVYEPWPGHGIQNIEPFLTLSISGAAVEGYDYEFMEEIPEALKCLICLRHYKETDVYDVPQHILKLALKSRCLKVKIPCPKCSVEVLCCNMQSYPEECQDKPMRCKCYNLGLHKDI